jgi:hypothetical protein
VFAVNAPPGIGENGIIGNFVLGSKYAPIEKEFLKGIDILLDYIKVIDSSLILPRDWKAIDKQNMNNSTIKVLENLSSFDTTKTMYELKLLKNGNIYYQDKIITNLNNKDAIKILKQLASQPSNLKTFSELQNIFSQKIEKVSTPFFFIGAKNGSKTPFKLIYVDSLKNLKLKNIDQNGPKYYIEL